MFGVQAFVVPPFGGVATLTVTTPVPAWEDEARTVARDVAGTLAFVPLEADA